MAEVMKLAERPVRELMTPLWRETQAPILLSVGRLAKYARLSAREIFSARPEIAT